MSKPAAAGIRAHALWWALPAVGAAFTAVAYLLGVEPARGASLIELVVGAALIPVLFTTVFAAVHHSDVIADRTGEPYGTLILTAAVTIIELALIISAMTSGKGNAALARDAVFAVVMIVCNGLVGLCIVIGGIRHGEQSFRVTGASSYLSVLMVLAVLTLVLPNYTSSTPGPFFSESQLVFISIATIALYAVFLYIQTIRHREYFIAARAPAEDRSTPPSMAQVAHSLLLLLVSLATVILLAKKFAGLIETALAETGMPEAVTGVLVAFLVLLPEAVAAIGAARRDELQKSINLALGSSLASIGLTVPAIGAAAIAIDRDLLLGIDGKHTVLLFLTFAVSLLTFATGRTNILSGFVHLVLFATFSFLVLLP